MNALSIEALRRRVAAGDMVTARSEIERIVVARRDQRSEHTEWGLLCEEAGLLSLAFSEFQLALRDNREDAVAAYHLAQHYRERGDNGRAQGLLARLLEKQPANLPWLELYVELLREDGAAPRIDEAIRRAETAGLPNEKAQLLRRAARQESEESPPPAPTAAIREIMPTDADCIRFHTLFSGREGVYARQWVKPNGEGGYSPIQEPMTPAVVRNHLLGTHTIGAYVLRLDATATFFALDLDIDKQALQQARGDHAFAQSLRAAMRQEGVRLLDVLRQLGFQPLFENSGYKGRHYWVFLEQPETAEVLHLLGRLLLAWQSRQLPPGFHLEFFPKQATLKGKGLGNLIKLPLGIHRRTGYRSQFLDDQGQAAPDQLAALREVVTTPQAVVYAAIEQLKALAPSLGEGGSSAGGQTSAVSAGEESAPRELGRERQVKVSAPPPPPPAPMWTEADFEADPRVRHLLAECPLLAELKDTVDEHRRLSHEEQLVLIHTLGHLEGGPQAVNYLFDKCVDVGPEKFMKDRLKGNPVSCPSIRKKVPHLTRRVNCHCPFEFAADRYPTPVLHLLTLPQIAATTKLPTQAPGPDVVNLAQRFGVMERRRAEIEREWVQLREALSTVLRAHPERSIACEGGRYRLVEREGIEELVWEVDSVAVDGDAASAKPQ